ncbi:mucin-2-like isoform X5 [Myxocyprinus asiaticus]|uniref:mucin-2-like isoform X5 n=1 Tax=Myxocyprinus asiaticus TaxID=70543 RepID=UPI0022229C4F|nr:mucin-2-like isoform X5 [Myxocyprinus asiaticus]
MGHIALILIGCLIVTRSYLTTAESSTSPPVLTPITTSPTTSITSPTTITTSPTTSTTSPTTSTTSPTTSTTSPTTSTTSPTTINSGSTHMRSTHVTTQRNLTTPFNLTTTMTTTSTTQVPFTYGSCEKVGMCCPGHNNSCNAHNCFCDVICLRLHDCCPDFKPTCLKVNNSTNTTTPSTLPLTGNCSAEPALCCPGYNINCFRGCFCDEACKQHNDCCPDFNGTCWAANTTTAHPSTTLTSVPSNHTAQMNTTANTAQSSTSPPVLTPITTSPTTSTTSPTTITTSPTTSTTSPTTSTTSPTTITTSPTTSTTSLTITLNSGSTHMRSTHVTTQRNLTTPFNLTTTMTTTSTTQVPFTYGSCEKAGMCCPGHNNSCNAHNCFCDVICLRLHDCCPDFKPTCLKVNNSTNTTTPSTLPLTGNCSAEPALCCPGYNINCFRGCFCDEACKQHNDCCPDFNGTCWAANTTTAHPSTTLTSVPSNHTAQMNTTANAVNSGSTHMRSTHVTTQRNLTTPFNLTTTMTTTSTTQVPFTYGSCEKAGMCCPGHNNSCNAHNCFCDVICLRLHDCCPDFKPTCLKVNNSTNTTTPSTLPLTGNCSAEPALCCPGYNINCFRGCFCDEACKQHNDCCPDFNGTCWAANTTTAHPSTTLTSVPSNHTAQMNTTANAVNSGSTHMRSTHVTTQRNLTTPFNLTTTMTTTSTTQVPFTYGSCEKAGMCCPGHNNSCNAHNCFCDVICLRLHDCCPDFKPTCLKVNNSTNTTTPSTLPLTGNCSAEPALCCPGYNINCFRGCFCDEACKQHNDCCPDFNGTCWAANTTTAHPSTTLTSVPSNHTAQMNTTANTVNSGSTHMRSTHVTTQRNLTTPFNLTTTMTTTSTTQVPFTYGSCEKAGMCCPGHNNSCNAHNCFCDVICLRLHDCCPDFKPTCLKVNNSTNTTTPSTLPLTGNCSAEPALCCPGYNINCFRGCFCDEACKQHNDCCPDFNGTCWAANTTTAHPSTTLTSVPSNHTAQMNTTAKTVNSGSTHMRSTHVTTQRNLTTSFNLTTTMTTTSTTQVPFTYGSCEKAGMCCPGHNNSCNAHNCFCDVICLRLHDCCPDFKPTCLKVNNSTNTTTPSTLPLTGNCSAEPALCCPGYNINCFRGCFCDEACKQHNDCCPDFNGTCWAANTTTAHPSTTLTSVPSNHTAQMNTTANAVNSGSTHMRSTHVTTQRNLTTPFNLTTTMTTTSTTQVPFTYGSCEKAGMCCPGHNNSCNAHNCFCDVICLRLHDCCPDFKPTCLKVNNSTNTTTPSTLPLTGNCSAEPALCCPGYNINCFRGCFCDEACKQHNDCCPDFNGTCWAANTTTAHPSTTLTSVPSNHTAQMNTTANTVNSGSTHMRSTHVTTQRNLTTPFNLTTTMTTTSTTQVPFTYGSCEKAGMCCPGHNNSCNAHNCFCDVICLRLHDCCPDFKPTCLKVNNSTNTTTPSTLPLTGNCSAEPALCCPGYNINCFRGCFCDEACKQHNDCCPDFNGTCWAANTTTAHPSTTLTSVPSNHTAQMNTTAKTVNSGSTHMRSTHVTTQRNLTTSFNLTTTMTTTSTTQVPFTYGSCEKAGMCCPGHNNSCNAHNCFCDVICLRLHDCCPDFKPTCLKVNNSTNTTTPSTLPLTGNCSAEPALCCPGYNINCFRGCFCDEACKQHNDCCPDFNGTCWAANTTTAHPSTTLTSVPSNHTAQMNTTANTVNSGSTHMRSTHVTTQRNLTTPFNLTTTMTTTSTTQVPFTYGSCEKAGMCCPGHNNSCNAHNCFCDVICLRLHDCCPDFKPTCLKVNNSTNTTTPSTLPLTGNCSAEPALCCPGYNINCFRGCFCDEACKQHNDCCPDFNGTCWAANTTTAHPSTTLTSVPSNHTAQMNTTANAVNSGSTHMRSTHVTTQRNLTTPFNLTTTMTTTSTTQVSFTYGSCEKAGMCCPGHNNSCNAHNCFCDVICLRLHDCCPDFKSTCLKVNNSTNTTTPSTLPLTGNCSAEPALCCPGYNINCFRGCFCDEACKQHNDCCPDFNGTCWAANTTTAHPSTTLTSVPSNHTAQMNTTANTDVLSILTNLEVEILAPESSTEKEHKAALLQFAHLLEELLRQNNTDNFSFEVSRVAVYEEPCD